MLLSFYPVDYAFLILLGLGSSLHCAGMCGPIACSYALPLASQKPSLLWSYHLRYILGRLLVYGWLGALMGAIGICLLYTSPSPRDVEESRMPSSA